MKTSKFTVSLEEIYTAIIQTARNGNIQEEKVIGYIFKRPCVVKLENKQNLSDLQGNRSFEIGMFPWIPLSADQDVPVSADWVITLVEPIEKLKVMYEKGVLNNGQADKTFSDDEQPDSDIGD